MSEPIKITTNQAHGFSSGQTIQYTDPYPRWPLRFFDVFEITEVQESSFSLSKVSWLRAVKIRTINLLRNSMTRKRILARILTIGIIISFVMMMEAYAQTRRLTQPAIVGRWGYGTEAEFVSIEVGPNFVMIIGKPHPASPDSIVNTGYNWWPDNKGSWWIYLKRRQVGRAQVIGTDSISITIKNLTIGGKRQQ